MSTYKYVLSFENRNHEEKAFEQLNSKKQSFSLSLIPNILHEDNAEFVKALTAIPVEKIIGRVAEVVKNEEGLVEITFDIYEHQAKYLRLLEEGSVKIAPVSIRNEDRDFFQLINFLITEA